MPSNTAMLVQIQKHKGRITRVKRGLTPIVELHVLPHQRVISIDLKEDARQDPLYVVLRSLARWWLAWRVIEMVTVCWASKQADPGNSR